MREHWGREENSVDEGLDGGGGAFCVSVGDDHDDDDAVKAPPSIVTPSPASPRSPSFCSPAPSTSWSLSSSSSTSSFPPPLSSASSGSSISESSFSSLAPPLSGCFRVSFRWKRYQSRFLSLSLVPLSSSFSFSLSRSLTLIESSSSPWSPSWWRVHGLESHARATRRPPFFPPSDSRQTRGNTSPKRARAPHTHAHTRSRRWKSRSGGEVERGGRREEKAAGRMG